MKGPYYKLDDDETKDDNSKSTNLSPNHCTEQKIKKKDLEKAEKKRKKKLALEEK